MNFPKIIECFGLPGSGKSTYISQMKKQVELPESVNVYLRKEGDSKFLDKAFDHPNTRIRSLLQFFVCIYYVIQRPFFFVAVLKSLVIYRFNRNYFSVLRNLTEALYCYSKLNRIKKTNDYMLLDEGLIQYLGALVINTPYNKKLPQGIVNHVLSSYIDGLIHVEIDFETAIRRIKDRNDGKSRFDYMKDEQAITNFKKMNDVFNLCIVTAQKLNIPILKLDNKNPSDENIRMILGFFKKSY